MQVEFTTELNSKHVLPIPEDIAAQLPKTGQARVIILTPEDSEDSDWRKTAYEHFMRDDSTEDAVYDSYA